MTATDVPTDMPNKARTFAFPDAASSITAATATALRNRITGE